MARTEYFRAASGSVLYAKPLPLQTVDWGADVIAGAENGTTGSFAFAGLDDNTDYEVFEQSGATPAATDVALGMLAADPACGTVLTGPHLLTVTVTDDQAQPIEAARVRVTRSGASQSAYTDAAGQVVFAVDPGGWTLAADANGYQPVTQQVSVAADTSASISLTPYAVSAPADPALCVVQCWVRHNGLAIQGAVCKARLVSPTSIASQSAMSTARILARTDAAGYAELQLVRQSAFIAGDGLYEIEIWHGDLLIYRQITAIPDQPAITLDQITA